METVSSTDCALVSVRRSDWNELKQVESYLQIKLWRFSKFVRLCVWCVGVGVFTENNVGNAVETVMRHPWGMLLFKQRSLLGLGGCNQLLFPDWESSLIERCHSTSRIDTQSQRTVLGTVHVVRQRKADDDKGKGEWWEEGRTGGVMER